MTAPHNKTEKGTCLSQRTVLILASLPTDGQCDFGHVP